MAQDWTFTEEVVDAVLAVLRGAEGVAHTGGLPGTWFPDAEEAPFPSLRICDHGDLRDYPKNQTLLEYCPGVLVWGNGTTVTNRSGTGGVAQVVETVRLAHIRGFDQAYPAAGILYTSQARARAAYAKIIGKALFNDPHRRLATITAGGTRQEVSLTCADGAGAQVVTTTSPGWDLGHDVRSPHALEEIVMVRTAGLPLWAIGIELHVTARVGGRSA